MQMWDHLVCQLPPCPVLQLLSCRKSSPPWLPIFAPPTSLDECFFFNSLATGLSYSGPNERNNQNSTKQIKLSIEEIANLSDAEFKTLVIRMLTEMVQYGHKIEERMKAMKVI